MAADIAQEKQQVHELVDRLPHVQVAAVRVLLEAMLDPLANATEDDEPVTEEDRVRLREGQEWLARRGGKGIPMEEILDEFGLKLEDFPAASKNTR